MAVSEDSPENSYARNRDFFQKKLFPRVKVQGAKGSVALHRTIYGTVGAALP